MQKLRFQIFLVLSFSLLTSFFYSQINLVPNPSFETYTACPSSTVGGGINLASGWFSCGVSPDYFNICASSTFSLRGVPSNELGYQNTKDGNAYGGLVTYNSGNGREYISTALSQTLAIGTKYYVSAYISRADSFPYNVASNKFGFRFSTISFTYSTSLTDNFSHIHSNNIIYDSLGWTKISGSFVADSVYQYFIIGNFYNDANTAVTNSLFLAYYYVDQTCVSTDSTLCGFSTGFNEKKLIIDVSVYPNPANTIITFENIFQSKKFSITNNIGIVVKHGICDNKKNTINVSDLENGVYFLVLQEKRIKVLINH